MSEQAVQASGTTEIVYVDLDRCLLLDDSISGFLTRLVDLGLAPRRTLVKGFIGYIGYRFNWIDATAMAMDGISYLQGLQEAELKAAAARFFEDVLRFRYRHTLLREIERHRTEGRKVHLLTGGLPYIPKHIAADLNLDGAWSSRAEVQNGRFTGRTLQPPCVGEGKIVYAQKAAEFEGAVLSKGWFYTDSYSDYPLLELVANPVAVNPDRALRKTAVRREWPILT